MFANNSYVSVWKVDKGTRGNGNYYDVRISSSRKRKDTGEYETDFSGFVRFAGKAADVVAPFDGQDSHNNGNKPITRLKLINVGVSNSYNSEKKITYWNPVVFEAEEASDNNHSSSGGSEDSSSFMTIPEGAGSELPFA